MSGQAGGRGYLLQAIVCLLQSLDSDSQWVSICVEPNNLSEKVDILWEYAGGSTNAVQVKSSQNQIGKAQVETWAGELESSYTADEYELLLVGPCSLWVTENRQVGRVRVPTPHALNVMALVGETAHLLDKYLARDGISKVPPFAREFMVKGLVTELESYSTRGASISRRDFDALLSGWMRILYPNSVYQAIDVQCDLLVDTVFITTALLVNAPPPSPHNSIHLVIPMTFVNGGVRTATVDWVAVKVKPLSDPARTKLYIPEDLVNHKAFAAGGGALHYEHVLYQFSEFPILPGNVVPLSIHFSQEKKSTQYPPTPWSPGGYAIEIYVKYRDREIPSLQKSLEVEVTTQMLAQMEQGTRPQARLTHPRKIDI